MEEEKKSFWTTLPGMLTAVAGIMGSIVTILTLLHSPATAPAIIPQIDSFSAIPPQIDINGTSILEWKVSKATSDTRITIDQNIGDIAVSGTMEVQPKKTTSYTLTAINSAGSDTEKATVIVNAKQDVPHAVSATPVETSPSPAKTSSIIVDQMGRGDYTTISDAISAARPGAEILIEPGVYDEGLTIDKPLEIKGNGNLGDVVIRAIGKDAILFNAVKGKVSNLVLKQNGGGNWFGVKIPQGCLELKGCDITSNSWSCVAIYGNAYPILSGNKIHDGNQSGIIISGNGQGMIENNDIFGNTLSGIETTGDGNPTIRGNKIHDGKSSGVYVYENGQGMIEDNDIFDNTLAGITIKENGNPTVRCNKIHDGKSSGVYVYENGQGTIEDNDIFANVYSGIEIREGGNPTIRGNKIHDGKQDGVYVHENGQGTIEDNDILTNAYSGIEIKDGGNPTVQNNRINHNSYQAIYIHDKGAGTIENNDLRNNQRGAWSISEDSKANITRSGNLE